MKKETLPRIEWDFDPKRVPDSELVACYYWEYARESAFIRDVLLRWHEHLRTVGGLPNDKLETDLLTIESGGDAVQIFLAGISKDECFFPTPWQLLPPEIKQARWRIHADFDKPFRRAHWSEARKMVQQCEATARQQRVERMAARASGRVVPLSPVLAQLRFTSGHEIALVQIHWSKFTNPEIAAAIKKWVTDNRPKDVPEPRKRGHSLLSFRVRLERLGIMRLLHRYTLGEMRDECPEAWKHYNVSKRRWSRDVETARVHFREMFPFLANQEPRSWPSKS